MTACRTPLHPHTPRRTAGMLAALALAAVAALATGCGGGGGDSASSAGSSAPPTVTATGYTQGTVTGFGSVVVNGVRFDDSSASVADDAGTKTSASALHLGMRVEVDHGAVDSSSASAKAVAFRYGSLVLGVVSAVDAKAGTLTVLGQVVDVSSSTVFDDALAAGLSAVAVGTVVEVHGLVDSATGHIGATRIESETGATAYKLRGTVAALDSATKTFSINGTLISYASLDSTLVPGTLANGSSLRVLLATAQVNGKWVAQSLGIKTSTKPADNTTAQVRGNITAFTSAASFTVGGLVVDASTASFPDGSSALALGVQVEVQGTVTHGVLVATKVEVESKHRGDDSHALQLIGAITALDSATKTFVVRGVTVSRSSATIYVNGVEADLAVGRKVHVKGALGSTRTQVLASHISFD